MGDRSVTIAIPVYNGANYLGEAIESALRQTHPQTEVLVVDDGSDDEGQTVAVAQAFGDRIRYLHQANGGVSAALNTALAHASGRLFSWLSHDDLFEPEKTALQVRALEAVGREDLCLFSDLLWIDAEGRITGQQRLDHANLAARPRLAFYDGLINGCTILTSRDLLRRIGGFDTRYPNTQDYRMWWRLTREASFVHVPQCLVRSRLHPGQGSHRNDALTENSAFWIDVLDGTSDLEATLVHGSRERFLRRTAEFLRYRSPNRRVADRADAAAQVCAAQASVSVVLDVGDDLEAARAAIASVEAQTRRPDEIVVVGAPALLDRIGREGTCERVLRPTAETRLPIRLRLGLTATRGSYVALLLSPDRFAPSKLAIQVAAMSAAGGLLSHHSYRHGERVFETGSFGGRVYPEIVGDCHIEASTVMLHRALFLSGLLFMDEDAPLAANWIEAAASHSLIGLEPALSEIASPQAAVDNAALLTWLRRSPFHRGHSAPLHRLQQRIAAGLSMDNPLTDRSHGDGLSSGPHRMGSSNAVA